MITVTAETAQMNQVSAASLPLAAPPGGASYYCRQHLRPTA